MKITRVLISAIVFVSLFLIDGILTCNARAFLETKVISGKLTAIDDGAIQLKGKTYYAASAIGVVSQSVGDNVSVRYYIDGEKNVFVEIKSGADSLQKLTPPATKTSKQK